MGVFILCVIAFVGGLVMVGIYEVIALETGLPTWSSMIREIIAHFEPTRQVMERADVKRAARRAARQAKKMAK